MKKVLAITFKELTHYFKSPTAYIVIFAALAIFNTFFYLIINENREAHLRDILKVMEFIFVFLVPVLTMKIFAEEKQVGTMEFLLTTPTKISQIVLGKLLGSFLCFFIIILCTKVYQLIMYVFAKPDMAAICAGYLGLCLEGALFLSIGIFISALTRSQMVAAVASYLVLFFLYFGHTFIHYAPNFLEKWIKAISVMTHTQNMFLGLIHLSDLVYFVSGIIFFFILTCLSLDRKRWQ